MELTSELRIILNMAGHAAIPYFFYSLGILLREGLEAMLVIVALAAGTRDAGGQSRARDVYAGAIAAIVASIAIAWAVNHVIGDDASDTLEGAFQFLAAATLFYVSSWLTSKAQADRWNKFIAGNVRRAERSSMPALALGTTAFLAVIREGGETIVFFQGLTAGATEAIERHAIAAGIIVAAAGLAALFWILTRAAYRIPIGPFFSITSILLYALAVVFVGQGVGSWQEANVLPATFVDHIPQIPTIGLFPTIESMAAQFVLIMLAIAAVLAPRSLANRRIRVARQTRQAVRPT
jgi:high-affinity iron transporter